MLQRLRERIGLTDVVMWLIGALILVAICVGSIITLFPPVASFLGMKVSVYSFTDWTSIIISGLTQGSIYACIALGYTMVYGTLRMINFAHSEVFMSGPYTAYFVAAALNTSGFLDSQPIISLAIIFLVAMAVSCTIAVLLERICYRPLRGAPRLIPLITAIGASFFLQYTFRGLYGTGFQAYPEVKMLAGRWVFPTPLGELRIEIIQVVVIAAAAVLMAGLYLFVQRTRMGKAIRAVSEDKEAAALMGIDMNRIIVITFIIGGLSAGVAGVLYALIFKQVYFLMGFIPGIKAFTAAVLGGIGNIPGAMLGGVFLGLIESLGPNLFLNGLGIPAPNQLKDAIAFVMLVLVLIFRPTGILGERLAVKKA